MEQEILDANQDIDDDSSDTSTQDTSSDDVKHIENEEDLDNVPFHKHPRFKELIDERNALKSQLSNLSYEMQEIKTKIDKPVTTDVDSQLKEMSTDQLQDLYDSSIDIESPNYEQLKPLRRNISRALDDKRIEKTVKVLTFEDENKRIQKEKVDADTRALGAYPDIGNSQSELFKITQQVMAEYAPELKRAGTNIDRMPRFLEICVNEAAKRLGVEAKIALKKGQSMEYDRQLAAGKAGLDAGVTKSLHKEPEISESLKKMATEMGNDPKKVAARLAKMKGGK